MPAVPETPEILPAAETHGDRFSMLQDKIERYRVGNAALAAQVERLRKLCIENLLRNPTDETAFLAVEQANQETSHYAALEAHDADKDWLIKRLRDTLREVHAVVSRDPRDLSGK